MPSKFDADFDAAVTSQAIADFAEMVAVIPNGHSQRNISAIVMRETRGPMDIEMRGNVYNSMQILIPANDSTGIASPGEMKVDGSGCDIYPSLDGKYWRCQRILERAVGGWHKLLLADGGS